jgi:large subunit ribosomal protein L17
MKKLNRYSEHRTSMIRNLCISLIKYGTIFTTLVRAKDLRGTIEPLITRAKEVNLHNRRLLLASLNNNEDVVNKLFQIGEMNRARPGGYTQVLRSGFRSDGGTKGMIRIIDYPSGVTDGSNKE